ncbi:DUF3592 domain-containing protein [Pseudomonas luteola]
MNNSILFISIFGIASIVVAVNLYQEAKAIMAKLALVEAFIKKASSWPKIEALVTELGINLDYPWPEGERDYSDPIEANRLRNQSMENSIYFGTLVKYSFSVDGIGYASRNIQIIPMKAQHHLVYKLNKGDKILARYNPENPEECYLIKNTEKEFQEYSWLLLKDLLKPLFMLLASLSLFFVLLIVNLG